MNYYIQIKSRNKAKNDIDSLMKKNGFVNVAVNINQKGKVRKFLYKLLSVLKLYWTLQKDDTLVIQYPFKKFYELQCNIAHKKGAKVVTLIHDLGTFRRHKLTATQEIKRLSHSDFIIAHNPSMIQWLKNHGCKQHLISLDILIIWLIQNQKMLIHNPHMYILYMQAVLINEKICLFIN